LAKICFKMVSARAISSDAGTTSFTNPIRMGLLSGDHLAREDQL